MAKVIKAARAKGSPRAVAARRMVDEGLLIVLSAVRMAVKNRIIIGALRDHQDFDDSDYPARARLELERIARQNEADARRVMRARKKLLKLRWSESLDDDRRNDIKQLVLRRKVYKSLALALRAVAADDAKVAGLVEASRTDASHEVGNALTVRLIEQAFDHAEPDYVILRGERMETLADDLAALMAAPLEEAETP